MSLLFLPLLSACALVSDADLAARMDLDGDGAERPDDCDDDDATVGLPTEWLVDEDGDGYGGTGTRTACASEGQVASVGGDCDDSNPSAYPGATETCDGVDEDCDGATDEDVTPTWCIDADEDGYGSEASTRSDCAQPSGFVANADDCDDTRADLNSTTPWYADADEDGYGDAASTTASCAQPAGYVASSDDCDDTRGDVSPGDVETCDVDDTDEDCDGLSDDDERDRAVELVPGR